MVDYVIALTTLCCAGPVWLVDADEQGSERV